MQTAVALERISLSLYPDPVSLGFQLFPHYEAGPLDQKLGKNRRQHTALHELLCGSAGTKL